MKIQVTKDELIMLVDDCVHTRLCNSCDKCVLNRVCHEFQEIADFIPSEIIEVVGEDDE